MCIVITSCLYVQSFFYEKDICLFDFVFFFQAEVGIRYAQESRGLGDVYKRQQYDFHAPHHDEGVSQSSRMARTSRSAGGCIRKWGEFVSHTETVMSRGMPQGCRGTLLTLAF